MNLSKEHSDFLARYQGHAFDQKLENGSPSQKADILRSTLAHLQFAKISGLIEETAVRPLIREYESMYANIVDCFDEHTGLNNFAEGALALCTGKKNESKDWKSSLTVDKIMAMKGVQQHVKQTKMSNEKSLPRSKRNEPLPMCLSENRSETGAQSSGGLPSLARATQSAGNQSSRMMNLYGNQSRVDNQLSGQNQSRVDNQLPGQSFVRNSSVPEAHKQQSSNRHNDMGNKRPLFSTGGRQTPFGQYGSKQTPTLAEKNTYEQSVGNKRPFGGQAATQYEDERPAPPPNVFKTAKEQMAIDNQKKYGGGGGRGQGSLNTAAYGTGKKSLGTRRGLNSKFVPPVVNREDEDGGFSNQAANTITKAVLKTGGNDTGGGGSKYEGMDDDKLKGVEAKMIEMIMNEIMDNGPPLTWDDVAGLEFAKKTIKEIVVWPMLRPDIFTGLRGPPKGLLLFGPPGTGKTLIGKCIASQSKSTFFCISASSLTSKWVGEGEKMVRALFAVARAQQPAVVFIDEIDSLLTQRTDGENEASRRIKTEFLVQLDGAATSADDRILVIGATNRPQEIDEAARRRFVKRLYIPLPEQAARRTIIVNLLRQQAHHLAEDELESICSKTQGFSGADMATLCREAALGPIRDMSFGDIEHISADQVRPITFGDFTDALHNVRPSVSDKDLDQYLEWNQTYGSGGR